MTTYPSLMEIVHEKADELYSELSTWHTEELNEANDEIFGFESAISTIREALPQPDGIGEYDHMNLFMFMMKVREVMNDIGNGWEVDKK